MARTTITSQEAGANASTANGSIFFIGTATVLLRYAGFTILTDPNFLHKGEQVRLGYGLRSTRRTNPAMEIDDLPPLDLVVLSHMHEDHFDRVAQNRLDKDVPIVSTPHAVAALKKMGFTKVEALETWGSTVITKGAEDGQGATRQPDPLQRLHRVQVATSDFAKAVKDAGLQSKVRYMKHGNTYTRAKRNS